MSKRSKPEVFEVPYCKVNPNSVIIYKHILSDEPRAKRATFVNSDGSEIQLRNFDNLKNNLHDGFLSDKAASRLRTAIKLLFWISGLFSIKGSKCLSQVHKKVSLITLTLCSAQFHDDNFIKKNMLNQFFVELRKYNKNLQYIWRAEKQKNGNIHFHILINIYLPYLLLRKIWNRIQEKTGYLQEYTSKFKNMSFVDYCLLHKIKKYSDIHQRRKAYNYGISTNWKDPNSTDIHSLKNVYNGYKYISKYLAKSDINIKNYDDLFNVTENENSLQSLELLKVTGRIWFCSEKISDIKIKSEVIQQGIENDVRKLFNDSLIVVKDYVYTQVALISAERLYNLGLFSLFRMFINNFKNSFLNININF